MLNNQLGKFPRPDDSLETILIIPDGEDVNVPGGGYLEVASSTPGEPPLLPQTHPHLLMTMSAC